MKTLVVGGTGFLGGAIVDAALAAGHDVTILSRGQTKRTQPSNVKILAANRYSSLDVLKNQNFDYVFDTCAFTPDGVQNLLNAVGRKIKRYIMISSISAYSDFSKPQLTEREPAPTAVDADYVVAQKCIQAGNVDAVALGASYGRLKRACEIKATDMLAQKSISLRVGLLVGAGDYTDRLTWWVRRFDQGGDILAPLPKNQTIQIVDVRDVAGFALHSASQQLSGIYNITSQPIDLENFLTSTINIIGSGAKLKWVDQETIQKADIQYWSELPIIAPTAANFRHFLNINTSKAMKAGLKIRPLEDTIKPLLEWDRTRRNTPLKCGLPKEKEQLALKLTAKNRP